MVTVHIDGVEYEVQEGSNLLAAALSLGLDLPYFCWHPALGSVGACRQCAVLQYRDEEAEQQGRGRLVMACMTPASDGARVSIRADEAAEFRASVVEWLMVNHPHDCPVCDEGGECHLQDMTVMTGHDYREFRFDKRTHRNQDLGPLIEHEMNRCIACYRCVRFYEYAGGDDLHAFAAHDHVYFGRHEDGPLESPFAGNLVEVCPTGVFTDKTSRRHYTRRWDLQTAPSVCVHCGLGCNTIPGERYGTLRRVRNRYHPDVNGYFLCDRGRYGYEFVDHERRVREPLAPRGPDEAARALDAEAVSGELSRMLAADRRVLGIGSPRASLESNYALRRLVGDEAFHLGLSDHEAGLAGAALEALRTGSVRIPPLRRIHDCDAVLVLGEDATNTAPLLSMALRQAARRRPEREAAKLGIPEWNDAAVREVVQDEHGPFFVATVAATDLDELATETFRGAPGEIARLGYAVARALEGTAPEVADPEPATDELATAIAAALRGAERPVIVSGSGAGSAAVIRAAAAVARALGTGREEPVDLFLTALECNTTGLAMLGGAALGEALAAAAGGEVDTLVVLENDLFRRAPRKQVEAALQGARDILVLDHVAHETGARADLVLPAATFAECAGTLVSNEGRAQRFYRVLEPSDAVRASWRWLLDGLRARQGEEAPDWPTLDDVVAALAEDVPGMAGVADAAPSEHLRIDGARIPRQSFRYSGRTAMNADRSVHEPRPDSDPDSPLADSMEGYSGQPPPALVPGYWAPGWNSVQSLNRFQEEVAGPLRGGSPGVRLLEPANGAEVGGGTEVPGAASEDGRLRLVPLHHVFGSEELSALALGIAAQAPEPYLALDADTAERHGLSDGDHAELVTDDGRRFGAPVAVRPDLPAGVAGVPVGLPGGFPGPLPERGRLEGSES